MRYVALYHDEFVNFIVRPHTLLLVQLQFQHLWHTTHCFLRRGAVAKCLCMDSLRPCTLLVVCEPIIMEGGGADEG